MEALSIHAPYVYDILTGEKTEEYRSWKPKNLGRILICSSAKKYRGFVSGFALFTVDVTGIREYPGEAGNGRTLYGWELQDVRFIEPFPVKGKLHLFDVDDSLIKPLHAVSRIEYMKDYYDSLL